MHNYIDIKTTQNFNKVVSRLKKKKNRKNVIMILDIKMKEKIKSLKCKENKGKLQK